MAENYSEDCYENSVLELLTGMGYGYAYGPDVERVYENPLHEGSWWRRCGG